MAELVSVVAAPSATLLAIAVIVVATETLVGSVLAVLVALASSLVTSSAKTAVSTSSLVGVKTLTRLLEVCRVATVAGLSLSRREG